MLLNDPTGDTRFQSWPGDHGKSARCPPFLHVSGHILRVGVVENHTNTKMVCLLFVVVFEFAGVS